jgi:uncharacterized membrane protein YgcG
MSRIVLAVTAALALCAGSAFADPQDEAMKTAPTTPPPLALASNAAPSVSTPAAPSGRDPTVAEQIDAFLKSSPALDAGEDGPLGMTSSTDTVRDNKIHGVVEASVGSHGYRNVYARSDIPLGDKAQVSIAVSQGRGRGYGYPYGGYGGGYFGGGGYYSGGGGWGPETTHSSVGLGFSFNSSSSKNCDRLAASSSQTDRENCRPLDRSPYPY